MRDYGRVHSSFWTSATIRSMSEDARHLALYLLTSPHSTIAGVFRLPDGYVCEDLQWGSERVAKGFEELSGNGFATRCETTKWVWIAKHFEWNTLDNPNQRTSAKKVALSVPANCSWLADFIEKCVETIGVKREDFPNPLPTVTQPLANQEQKQEQQQKQNNSSSLRSDAPGGAEDHSKPNGAKRPETPKDELYRRAKERLGDSAGGMVTSLIASRGGNVEAALHEFKSMDADARSNSHLRGMLASTTASRNRSEKLTARDRGDAW